MPGFFQPMFGSNIDKEMPGFFQPMFGSNIDKPNLWFENVIQTKGWVLSLFDQNPAFFECLYYQLYTNC